MNEATSLLHPSVSLKDTLGCLSNQLDRNQELSVGHARLYRKTSAGSHLHAVETAATGRGMLIGISMQSGHRRRILHSHHATNHEFETGSIYIRDFSDRYRADLGGAFDFMLMELSSAAIELAADERNGARLDRLDRVTGVKDEVLVHLACALAPSLEQPDYASLLFVEQTCIAMETYLLDRYGGTRRATCRTRRLLTHAQEARAKEMLRASMGVALSIAEVASACNLSRSYFIRAFRETTGQTPHQWLTALRVERARSLLLDFERPLAEIAAECGFADQSHFTRVFAHRTGQPPGDWRRKMRAAGKR